jgi:methyltransferase (TIGR00027 family)
MIRNPYQTGPLSAKLATIERYLPKGDRFIDDEFAFEVLPFHLQAFLRLLKIPLLLKSYGSFLEWLHPGLRGSILSRMRYIDDKLQEAANGEIQTIVNLGAGHDTRVHRLGICGQIPVWELDLPENVNSKKRGLVKAFGEIPPNLTLVPIDLLRQNIEINLASYGFNHQNKVFFIIEGVSHYLNYKCMQDIMKFFAKSTAGSRLVLTYLRKDFVDGKNKYRLEHLYDNYRKKNRIIRFGMDPDKIADFLDRYGWEILEHVGYDDLVEKYAGLTGRSLTSTPLGRMVYAVKKA